MALFHLLNSVPPLIAGFFALVDMAKHDYNHEYSAKYKYWFQITKFIQTYALNLSFTSSQIFLLIVLLYLVLYVIAAVVISIYMLRKWSEIARKNKAGKGSKADKFQKLQRDLIISLFIQVILERYS